MRNHKIRKPFLKNFIEVFFSGAPYYATKRVEYKFYVDLEESDGTLL